MIKKNLQPIYISILIIIGILIGRIDINSSKREIKKSKVDNILKLIEDHYVDSIQITFQDEVIESILKKLDPHTTYISKKEYQTVNESMSGEFSGIGIEFNIIKDTIVVISPISNGPSERLGIISGDRIVNIDDKVFIGFENSDVIKNLRGKKNTSVSVDIKRRGVEELINYNIKREKIPIFSVDVSLMIDSITGYIKINRFSATTVREFKNALDKLNNHNLKNLILDFRDNPGGYLNAAASICDIFLEKGELIVFTEGRNREKNEIIATSKSSLKETNLVILINEGSASASEIVAGAIQDNDRGIVIGRRSFGKGLVQEEINLKDGSAIRLTTQRYFTPAGRCIQKEYGINNKNYFMEQYQRVDSIIPDSLKFKTRLGRTVYGGGGINPDFIVNRDTSLSFSKINYIFSKGWISDFSLLYSEKHKSRIIDNKDIANNLLSKEFNNKERDLILNSFNKYIDEVWGEKKQSLDQKEEKYILTQIQSRVWKNLFGNEAFYNILHLQDNYIEKAKEILSD